MAALCEMNENRRFMKGIMSWVGFKTTQINYVRTARYSGKTKYNYWRLWNLAVEGITSFSTAPLRVWVYVGGIISLISIVYAVWIVANVLIAGVDVPGYASIIVSILFIGGIQLFGIGILGEYIGRIYMESKSRPIYIVDSKIE